MATNAAAVAIAMMNGGGGGSGGDVTKQYVDDHLALKADKVETAEYPIADSVSGDAVIVTNSADGYVQDLTVYGRSKVIEGEIKSIGDSGALNVQTCGKNLINPQNLEIGYYGQNGYISSINYRTSELIAVKPNTSYSSAMFDGSGNLLDVAVLTEWTSNEEFIKQTTDAYTIQTTANTAYIRVRNLSDYDSYITNNNYAFQLEVGSTATSYEPYISSTATLTTGLPYCGIPVASGETYTDEQGQKWLADTASVEGVVKRCYKVTFDGSENWVLDEGSLVGASGSRRITAVISDIPVTNVITTDAVPTIICNSLTPASRNTTYADNDNTISVLVKNNANEFQMRVSGIATAADLKTYLASNPLAVVYELATPTTIPLTTAEKSALLSLKTFDGTTNLSITDDPFVDISYIKNTANGKAAEQLADNLRASIGWISAVPEMHRNIFRGKYLGSAVSAAQLAAIEDGSFDDLYVGDYWTINNTVYRIADMDFFRTDANSPFVFTTHHLVIVPDGTMYKAKMNDSSATTSGGYKNSDMRTTNLSAAKTTINADFPDMVLTYKDLLVTATSSGMPTASDYFDCDIELMSETMLFGGYVNAKPANPPYFCASTNPTQFALFKLNPQFIITDKSETIWLRDAADGAMFCTMEYSPFGRGANYADGAVRPFFLIGDAT